MESRRRWGFIPHIYLPEYHPRPSRIPSSPPYPQRGLMFSKAERKRKGERDWEREKEKEGERGRERERHGSRKAESSCRALRTCQNLRGIRTLDTIPLLEWSGLFRQIWNNSYLLTGKRRTLLNGDYSIVNNVFDVY